MYQISLVILLFFQGYFLIGQNLEFTQVNTKLYKNHSAENTQVLLDTWLNDQKIELKNNLSFHLLAEHKTSKAIYYRYQLVVNSIPVYAKQVLVKHDLLKESTLISSSKYSFNLPNIEAKNADYWYNFNSTLIPIYRNKEKSKHEVLIYQNTEYDIKLTESTISNKKDSLITVQVFYPDPITSSKHNYGIPYADLNDTINTDLLAEHFLKNMNASFDKDTFKLESDYFKINEHSKPIDTIWYSLIDSAIYDRSAPNFEAINISFHLNEFRKYLKNLGYQQLGNRQILVDPHGFEGADLSSFNNLTQPVMLTFGTGGVDDGEDAGIIIHEYTHNLTDHASPKSNLGSQRVAIDEGICDYVAASYMRGISEHRWQDLFKWDGHNEFWAGRTIDFSVQYPNDTNGNIYETGGIISATLMELWGKIGKSKLDSLVFESMYSLMPNMNLLDYANVLVQTEDLLFAGAYKAEVCEALNDHGLGKPCFESSIAHSAALKPIVLNSEGFAKGVSKLTILTKSKQVEFEVSNIKGETLFQGTGENHEISLSPLPFSSTLLIISIQGVNQTSFLKVQRY
ncbi:MAG: hypothetical protein ACPGD5_01655 [Salibacteraceae bacterium]